MKHCALLPGRIPCHTKFLSHRDGLDRAAGCSASCSRPTDSLCVPSTLSESSLPVPGMPPSSAGPSGRSDSSLRKVEALPRCPRERRRHRAASEIRRRAKEKLPAFAEPCWLFWLWSTDYRSAVLL